MISNKHIKIAYYTLEIKVSLVKMVHYLKEIKHTSLLYLSCSGYRIGMIEK